MDSIFSADQWNRLDKHARAAMCRRFAEEAELLAQSAHPDVQQNYEDVADKWLHLAAVIER